MGQKAKISILQSRFAFAVLWLCGTGALLYFTIHTISQNQRNAFYTGLVLGVGCGMSFSLLWLVLRQLKRQLNGWRQAEAARQTSDARFAGILAIAKDAIISINQQHEITLFNQGAERIFGYTAEEAIGKPLNSLVPLRYVACHDDHIRSFGQSSDTARGMGDRREVFGRRKDGTEFPAEASISKFELGDEIIFTVILRDVTERKQAEQAQRESEERFRNAFDNAPIGLALVGLDGQWLQVNAALCNILGYSEPEFLETHFQTMIYLDDVKIDLHQIQRHLSHRSGIYEQQKRYIHKQGCIIWVLLRLSLMQDAQGQPLYFIAQIQDITEQREIERMKHEFISVVSHELRTPLTSIRGSINLLASGVLADRPQKAQRMLEIAAIDTERLVRLVNDILDLERLESGKVPLVHQWCNVADLMTQSVAGMQAIADKAEINLCVFPLSLHIRVARDRIIQAFTNLLSNAIKFSASGTTITLTAQLQNQHVLFTVNDAGKGIPDDQLEAIFGRFQQVDSSDSRQNDGTGLGLAICRSIIEQHGGNIWVKSTLGEGSTFYFTLPLQEG